MRLETTVSSDDISVFQTSQKVMIEVFDDGVLCKTKGSLTYLPGQIKDYKMVIAFGITSICLDKQIAKLMVGEIRSKIKQKEFEIKANTKSIANNAQRIISDFQRVLQCILNKIKNEDFRNTLGEGKPLQPSSYTKDEPKNTSTNKFSNDRPEISKKGRTSDESSHKAKNVSTTKDTPKEEEKKDIVNIDKGTLELDMSKPQDCQTVKKVLESLDYETISDCFIFTFVTTPKSCENVNRLLSDYFPSKVSRFCFKNSLPEGAITDYWSSLESISSRSIHRLEITNFVIPSDLLGNIIDAFSQVAILMFLNCKIEGEQIDIDTSRKFKIKDLVFCFCGEKERSDWNNNPQNLQAIIEAISKSDLKNSLKTLRLKNRPPEKMDIKTLRELFSLCSLPHSLIRY
ncbi:unnamed protein product [Moneuplotes crassus]|uniref:Uncharacterized protein n=1 Tax=Euplotes crassus TaxID=5936 RepID=A0AAD1UHQ9_EUPCR|nr:unnamed protein product [Moneuplotes crassus]